MFTLLSGLLGALIGALVTLVGVLLPLRAKRREERKRMIEAAVEVAAEAGKIITGLLSIIRDTSAIPSEGSIEIRAEWAKVRTRLVIVRQMYPTEDVRHSSEILWNKVDECLTMIDESRFRTRTTGRHAISKPNEMVDGEFRTSIEEGLKSALSVVNEMYRQLRSNLHEVDGFYRVSQAFNMVPDHQGQQVTTMQNVNLDT